MTYSLITASIVDGDLVSGCWIQDSVGTLQQAIEKARRTEAVNGPTWCGCAVVEKVAGVCPIGEWFEGLRRLDASRKV